MQNKAAIQVPPNPTHLFINALSLKTHPYQEVSKNLHTIEYCPFDPNCEDDWLRAALPLQGVPVCEHQPQGIQPRRISRKPSCNLPLGRVEVHAG